MPIGKKKGRSERGKGEMEGEREARTGKPMTKLVKAKGMPKWENDHFAVIKIDQARINNGYKI